MGEQKSKNQNNIVFIIIIVILLISVVILCGYIFLNKNNSTGTENITENSNTNSENENVQQSDKANNDVTEYKTNSTIIFDGSKSINSTEKDYTLASQGNSGIFVTVDSTQKGLSFSFTPTRVADFYALNWTNDNNYINYVKVNFDKKITDVFYGGMGQSSSRDTLFILLEDGTVEYIPIVHMLIHAQEELESYGKIDGVSDIVKFSLSNTSNGVTTLAIKKDGSFYDLYYALKDSKYYGPSIYNE